MADHLESSDLDLASSCSPPRGNEEAARPPRHRQHVGRRDHGLRGAASRALRWVHPGGVRRPQRAVPLALPDAARRGPPAHRHELVLAPRVLGPPIRERRGYKAHPGRVDVPHGAVGRSTTRSPLGGGASPSAVATADGLAPAADRRRDRATSPALHLGNGSAGAHAARRAQVARARAGLGVRRERGVPDVIAAAAPEVGCDESRNVRARCDGPVRNHHRSMYPTSYLYTEGHLTHHLNTCTHTHTRKSCVVKIYHSTSCITGARLTLEILTSHHLTNGTHT